MRVVMGEGGDEGGGTMFLRGVTGSETGET